MQGVEKKSDLGSFHACQGGWRSDRRERESLVMAGRRAFIASHICRWILLRLSNESGPSSSCGKSQVYVLCACVHVYVCAGLWIGGAYFLMHVRACACVRVALSFFLSLAEIGGYACLCAYAYMLLRAC